MLHIGLYTISLVLPGLAQAQWLGIPDGWTDGHVHATGIRIHDCHAVAQPDEPAIVMAHGGSD